MKALAFLCILFATTLKPLIHLAISSSSTTTSSSSSSPEESDGHHQSYDYYSQSCPLAEQIVRQSTRSLFAGDPRTAPQLLRLLFHDCFVHGCDGSVLLEENIEGGRTERDAIPNQTLKGFDKIDFIKDIVEEACPGVVSCADVLVLAAREGVLLTGGPFYPVVTGRKDSTRSYYETAEEEIPSPNHNVSTTLARFASKGFSPRETVSLLGAHNIGSIDCDFIRTRILNFSGTGLPDPSIPTDFLIELATNCSGNSRSGLNVASGRTSTATASTAIPYYQALSPLLPSGNTFGTHYYGALLKGRGLLFSDQQLMYDRKTTKLVEAYASDDGFTFKRDFARVMMKLSSLSGSISDQGPPRLQCSRLN
ncbi:hypothetical protein Scep_013429 [Stephania cephalantha]|uniref:Peroxidase n=1 Tax=Stephania cephalantha TaxID=152367 RepID=A0AAP0PAS2_9MAGN